MHGDFLCHYPAFGDLAPDGDLQIIVPQLGARVAPEKREAVMGTIDPRRSPAAQRDYIGAFFDLHLRGRDRHLFDGESPRHPNIDFID